MGSVFNIRSNNKNILRVKTYISNTTCYSGINCQVSIFLYLFVQNMMATKKFLHLIIKRRNTKFPLIIIINNRRQVPIVITWKVPTKNIAFLSVVCRQELSGRKTLDFIMIFVCFHPSLLSLAVIQYPSNHIDPSPPAA